MWSTTTILSASSPNTEAPRARVPPFVCLYIYMYIAMVVVFPQTDFWKLDSLCGPPACLPGPIRARKTKANKQGKTPQSLIVVVVAWRSPLQKELAGCSLALQQ
jgi:hypothetical protein